MGKFIAVLISIFLAAVLGIVMSLMIGPIYLEESGLTAFLGLTDAPERSQTVNKESAINDENKTGGADGISLNPGDNESREQAKMANHPLVGKWEIINHVEIDPHNMDEMGTIIEYFSDGTGVEQHAVEPVLRKFSWEAASGRITITPVDASFRIRSYDYELNGNIATYFVNINRTSYFEAIRIP